MSRGDSMGSCKSEGCTANAMCQDPDGQWCCLAHFCASGVLRTVIEVEGHADVGVGDVIETRDGPRKVVGVTFYD